MVINTIPVVKYFKFNAYLRDLNWIRDLHDWLQLWQDVLHEVRAGCLLGDHEDGGEDEGDHVRVHELLGEARDHAVQGHPVRQFRNDGGQALGTAGKHCGV